MTGKVMLARTPSSKLTDRRGLNVSYETVTKQRLRDYDAHSDSDARSEAKRDRDTGTKGK
jgi:hypothetical protein